MNQEFSYNPVLDDKISRNKCDKILPANIKNIHSNSINDNNHINYKNHYENMSITTNKIPISDEMNSTCLAIKRNPYSIEEILKKPEKNSKEKDNEHKKSNLIDIGCIDNCNELNSIHKKSRIRLKIYDFNV